MHFAIAHWAKRIARWLALGTYAAILTELYCWYAVPGIRVGPSFTVWDANHGFAIRKNFSGRRQTHEYDMTFTTGAQGFRGKTYSKNKPPGTYRIASLGNSQAFGVGVNDNQTYSYLLEQRLNAMGAGQVEVLNMAVTDAGTGMILSMWETILAYEPDVLLVRYDFWNFVNPFKQYSYRDGSLVHHPPYAQSLLRKTIEKSHVVRYLENAAWYGFVRGLVPTYSVRISETKAALLAPLHKTSSAGSAVAKSTDEQEYRLLRELVKRAQVAGIPLLMMKCELYPDESPAFRRDNPERDERVARIISASGVTVLDCTDLSVRRTPMMFFRVDQHLNQQGHAEVALRLSQCFCRAGDTWTICWPPPVAAVAGGNNRR